MINKNKFLITGGTGSFGKSMLSYLLKNKASEVRILSRDEKKQENLRLEINDNRAKFIIGDVRDINSIDRAMDGVDFVFQAAALKQVPTCEFFPMQAINTNVLGSENVLESAAKHNVKKMVVLSTDKAVYPINTMGMSKALMEKLAICKTRDARVIKNNGKIAVTRYGNVLCSRGSIIPLFIKQIKENKPLTITDPNMTRFMMTLPESVSLVMYAFNNAEAGDLFVQKSPSATIEQLANVLKDIFNSSVDIKVIGARHGEKLHETLCSREDMAKAEDLKNYYRIPADLRDINYNNSYGNADNSKAKQLDLDVDEYNSSNTHRLSDDALKELLLTLEYVKSNL